MTFLKYTAHLSGMLTERQRKVLEFIQAQESPPTAREIAAHFDLSTGTVSQHLDALRAKGYLAASDRKSRSLRVANSFRERRGSIVDIPLYGTIPAGFADERHQEAEGCVSVDAATLGTKPTRQMFALRVKGDSMIDKHILPGDIAVLDHGREARVGDVVAALIDGESTLKLYQTRRGKAFLRAANPKYPDLIPATELTIQGVLVAIVRQCH